MKENKLLIAILVGVILINLISDYPKFSSGVQSGAALFHYSKMIGTCESEYIGRETCKLYPPLFHIIGSFFVKTPGDYLNFSLVFFFVVSIMATLFLTKTWFGPLILLSGTSLVRFVLVHSVIPSYFAVLIFFCLFLSKNNLFRAILFISGMLTHNYFFILVLLGFFAIGVKKFLENGFLALIPAFTPFSFLKNFSGNVDYWFSSNILFITLIGFFQLIKEERHEIVLLTVFAFITSFDLSRAFFVVQIATIIGFVSFFQGSNRMNQTLMVLGIVLINAFNWIPIGFALNPPP